MCLCFYTFVLLYVYVFPYKNKYFGIHLYIYIFSRFVVWADIYIAIDINVFKNKFINKHKQKTKIMINHWKKLLKVIWAMRD